MEETSQDVLPLVRSIPTTKYIVDMTKLTSRLTKMPIGQRAIFSGTHGTAATLSNVSACCITSVDVVVYAAIANLYDAGNRSVTASMVARVMLGYPASSVSNALCQTIATSITKMSGTTIQIRAPSKNYNERLLNITPRLARTDNGAVCTHYYIDSEPVLLTYAKQIGHLYTYPVEAINTVGKLNNTLDVIIVRHYVLRRVAVTIRSGNYNRISYDTIAKECEVPAARVRRICKAVAEHLTDIGCLLKYAEYRQNRKYAGISISAAPKSHSSST